MEMRNFAPYLFLHLQSHQEQVQQLYCLHSCHYTPELKRESLVSFKLNWLAACLTLETEKYVCNEVSICKTCKKIRAAPSRAEGR